MQREKESIPMARKMSRREFLATGALAAAGVVASACGATPTPTPTKAPPTPTKAAAPPTAAPTAAPPTAAPTKPPSIELTLARYEHPAQPIQQNAPAHLAITQNTGVKLTFSVVPQSDWAAKEKIWLSTKQVPDVIQVTTEEIRDYASPSVLKPVMPLVNQYAPNIKRYMEAYPDMKKLAIGGELYHVPMADFNNKVNAPMPVIRKDILEKTGMPVPTTLEQLGGVLKEMKKAAPGSIGWTGRNGAKWLFAIVAYPMGSGYGISQVYYGPYFDKDVEGGKWLYGPIHPEFKDILAYFADLYKQGLFDPDYPSTTADQWHEKNSSGKGIFSWDNFSFCVRWNLALRGADPKATWTPIPTLAFKKWRRLVKYGGISAGWALGAGNKYPERTMQMLDWMCTPLGIDVTSWGIEGMHFTRKKPLPARIDDYTYDGLGRAMPPDRNHLLPDVFAKYKAKTDPFRAYQSDTGTGLLDFSIIMDQSITFLWDQPGEADAWYDMSSKDKALIPRWYFPPFTPQESERVKNIQPNLDTIVEPAFDKVILGQMSLSDYDKVVQDAIKAGAQELEKIYNEAEARLK